MRKKTPLKKTPLKLWKFFWVAAWKDSGALIPIVGYANCKYQIFERVAEWPDWQKAKIVAYKVTMQEVK